MENARYQIAARACDACRRRKLRCSVSATHPPDTVAKCVRCIQTDLVCTYDDGQRKRGPKSGRRLDAIRVMQQQHSTKFSSVLDVSSASDRAFREDVNGTADPQTSTLTPSNLLDVLNTSFNLDVDGSQAWREFELLTHLTTMEAEPHVDTDKLELPDSNLNLEWNSDKVWGDLQLTPHATNMAAETSSSAEGLDLGLTDPCFNLDENGSQIERESMIYVLDCDSELQLPTHIDRGLPISKESLAAEMSIFFEQISAAYPVIYWEAVIDKLNAEAYLSNVDFYIFLLSVGLVNEAFKLRYSSSDSDARLTFLASTIEDLRRSSNGYNFSDSPTLDTVVVSLFLFIAYSVCGKHNRAFTYLTEAIGLLDLIEEPSDPTEFIRLQRLEHVLFITESASVSIYGFYRKRKIARRPSNLTSTGSTMMWYHNSERNEEELRDTSKVKRVKLDRKAIKLLILMTRLHMASEVADVANVTVDDIMMANISASFDHQPNDQNIACSIQTADVAITRQWKLATHWWTVISTGNTLPTSTDNLKYTLQIIGMSTLQWSKTLSPGQLRIVGLGKIAGLTDAIFNIALRLGSLDSCKNILADLINTVAATDYDKEFAPRLSTLELCVGYVPRTIMSNEDLECLLEID